jgi:hypothetical protein
MMWSCKTTLTCEECGREITFECDPPDESVGLLGWSCGMLDEEFRTCKCDFTEEEAERLEYRASEKMSEPYEPDFSWTP